VSVNPAFGCVLARSPCGGLWLELAGAGALLRPSGALWLQAERLLVVSDLHLEKGSAYAARGQLLPPYDTRETLARLAAEAMRLNPRRILLLGDSFHDGDAEDRISAEDCRALCAMAATADLVWVVGNHDAQGPRRLPGSVAASWRTAQLCFAHEPSPRPASGEVAGHLHPCARVRGRSATVRRRCFATDGERLILPAFGAFAGGLNVRDPAFAGLFGAAPLAGVLGQSKVHPVAWTQLGPD
jgi:DNA ligase-associated metallophosphoesterase